MFHNQTLGRRLKQQRKPVEEICRTEEALTERYKFEARVERIVWEGNSFGSSPYVSLKTVHVQRDERYKQKDYLGTLDDSYRVLLPVTDKISDMNLQPFDIIQFKSRLKYKPKIGNTIYVYQARDIERIGTFVSSEEEVINNG